MYEECVFLMVFRHFYEGSDNRYDRPIFDKFGSSVPRRAASPVKLQKDGKFSLMCIGLHFGTGIINVSLTHFVSRRPITHGGR